MYPGAMKGTMRARLRVEPGKKAGILGRDPGDTAGIKTKEQAQEPLSKNLKRLQDLQFRLYAERRRGVLIILQAMDAAGKDGTIAHVMSGLNPQGCRVTSFKKPSAEELDHDFLWRIHKAVPQRGEIGIFNRSHYEEVLVVRVHELVPKSVWSRRYAQINAFEKNLTEEGFVVLKFFLHIDKDEQKERLKARIDDPTRHWKLAPEDFAERRLWDVYMRAYEDALTRCSTPSAPWHVIPANRKWFRNLAVSSILVETLEEMNPRFPPSSIDVSKLRLV